MRDQSDDLVLFAGKARLVSEFVSEFFPRLTARYPCLANDL
jgi:hypothetical protein